MARPKSERRVVDKSEIVQLRGAGPDGPLLPVPIEFGIYEALIDEEIAQNELSLKRATEPDMKETYQLLINRLKNTIDEADVFEGFCIPITIGEHNEYLAKNVSLRDVAKKHLCTNDGLPFFSENEELKPGAFANRAYVAIMEASGFGLSTAGKKAIREANLTAAELRIKQLKKKLETMNEASGKSVLATGSPSVSGSDLGRSLA